LTSSGPLSEQLRAIGERLQSALSEVTSQDALEEVRIRFLGRTGEITTVRRSIGALSPAERPGAGKVVNDATAELEAAVDRKRHDLESKALEAQLDVAIDVTFPGVRPRT
jgi:phenylalanyl-tRNA synthetase alpha chain